MVNLSVSSESTQTPVRTKVATWSELSDRAPAYALVGNVDLVVIRYDEEVSVLYGRCQHRDALMADGTIDGNNLICGVHGWDYRYDTGVSEYNNNEQLEKFTAVIDRDKDAVLVDASEIASFEKTHPQYFDRDEYLGLYQDLHGGAEEPKNAYIQSLARDGLSSTGHHGPVSAMGVPFTSLPRWDDLQILTAQLARSPLLDEETVGTELVIGPRAKKPLRLEIPLFVSDMSFGALSEEAKVALASGAERAGTGICSGEGGMLPEEQAANSRYFYELASGKFGFSLDKVAKCQAFHFKGGQGAKTGTGGHLPGKKVSEKIAAVRGLTPGEPAISPARFPDLTSVEDFQRVAEQVRETTGGIPVGFKMSAQHIEDDLDFALDVGADYVILDGRGGATGAAPENLQEQHLRSNDGGRRSGAAPSRPTRCRRRHPHRDRRAPHRRRLREGDGARCQRGGACQLRAPSDRLSRDAGVSYEQLSGGYRDTKRAPARAPRDRALRGTSRPFLESDGGSHANPRASLRAHSLAGVSSCAT